MENIVPDVILELIRANSVLDEPLVIPSERISGHNQPLDPANLSLLDVIRISDLAMRRIISMAKQISLFMGLGQEDQLALLKGGLTELLILRGAMVFDPRKDAWRHQIYCLPKANELNILGAAGSQSASGALNGQPNDMNLVHLTVDILKQAQEQQHYVEHKKMDPYLKILSKILTTP
ncbi:nuclear hormone receptor HR96 [Ditylenchus destructor]|uniref:Nuclear hormone receptor HR96 n=1 Tax=Ditylenchus destructor TaxID=166010 RepID=A0AAD4QUP4_9BILA|nr:nuclear hormone receptor HR96 [Ditylenchus destructor]